jgi:hypothetical protein
LLLSTLPKIAQPVEILLKNRCRLEPIFVDVARY